MIHVVTPVEHSPLGPSGAPRWINCPGSVKASQGKTDEESVFAAEGTAAHYIADRCFRDGVKAATFVGDVVEVGKHKFGVTDDWAQHIQEYLDWCAEVKGDVEISEEKVRYDTWVRGGFGWVDRATIGAGRCTIRDLKFGKGVQVWAKENEQLLMQALGVLESYPFDDIDEFVLGISQPRLDHRDEWRISRADLLKWARETLVPAIEEIEKGEKFLAGEWCQFCRFKRDCAVRANVGLHAAFGDLDDPKPTSPLLTHDKKAAILPLLSTIRSWLSDFEEGVIADLIGGKDVGGWKLVEGRSNRGWSDPDKVAKRVSPEDAFEKSLRSPAKLEKLLGKAKFSKILGELVVKPQGRPKLAPPDDPRPAMTNISVADFTNLDQEQS